MPPAESASRSSSTRSSRTPKIVFAVIFLIAVVSVVENVRLFGQVNSLKNPQALAQSQIQKVVAQVSKLVVLPTDETPTIATVSDLAKLKEQPFFANAKVGDQVIVYTNARKAILWRPSEDKIIEIAPLSINNAQTASAQGSLDASTPAPTAAPVQTTPSPSVTAKPKK